MSNGVHQGAPGDKVVILAREGDGPPYVQALDPATGNPFWRADLPDDGPGYKRTMAIGSGRVFVATGEGHLFCLHYDTGQLLWKTAIPRAFGGNRSQALLVVAADTLLIDYERRLVCFSLDGHFLWERTPIAVGAMGTPSHVAIHDYSG